MGKGGIVLGLIGILIGAGGLVVAFIVWNGQNSIQKELDDTKTELENILTELENNQTESSEQNIWYRYYKDTFDVDLINTYMEITNMTLNISLTTQKSIKFSFTGGALITGSSTISYITVYYSIDGLIISNPSAWVGGYNAGVGSADYHSVSLNHYIEGWAVGTHNVTMFARSTVDVNKLEHCRLIVESY